MLKRIWAGPWSLVGLLFAPFFRSHRRVEGALICEGASWPRKLGWRYRAITFGQVVLAVDGLPDPVLRHELAHVRQYERWGPLFIPAYLLASATATLRRRHYYRDNAFEASARRIAGT